MLCHRTGHHSKLPACHWCMPLDGRTATSDSRSSSGPACMPRPSTLVSSVLGWSESLREYDGLTASSDNL
ncbi:hypothetical protein KFL_003480140 [Klebsormidium nitens]|uniref:Uncharacterized protein n=1 Tax=Klebsormidium nitens TaxID=105231 RepID=A0A1Y1I8V9_KLENI|nr:hypothetical protein KFL_003480140 [Klebsormidium nitens]|eukprot:GAQ87370.1 hypothetical protein KFL_003480140 [Klebsormidium nitens]